MDDVEVSILSWTQLYPAIFPRDLIDRSSRTNILDGTDIQVEYLTNYNNPMSWYKTVRRVLELEPDMIIFQWSLAIQGIPLGWIARQISNKSKIEIVFDCHFVLQKEGSSLDTMLTRYGLSRAHTYITHASQTTAELQSLFFKRNFQVSHQKTSLGNSSSVSIIELYHPVYNLFEVDTSLDIDKVKEQLGLRQHVFLFFGFIRKYKGLHNVIKAFKILSDRREDVSLLICGESFWETLDQNKLSTKVKNFLFGIAQNILLKKKEKESNYRPLELINELGIEDKVVLKNEFIPNEDVNKYFQVSDAVLLFYEYATPSGVESISYNFRMPLLATAVGHFPDTVDDGVNGYLVEPDNIEAMAAAMEKFIIHPIDKSEIDKKVAHMSWANYASALVSQ